MQRHWSEIEKLSFDIEKMTVSLKCGFFNEYIKLKMQKYELLYQFKLKETREKEEQAIIREQMREEQKAERDLIVYEKALEKAKLQLQEVSLGEKSKLETRILFLEEQLLDAKNTKDRALSMAQQTKRGYVYVISNVGSFGENVYKIGLTRRLEPIDRVNELCGASVPFKYNVHAMIYSKNAPMLESDLHQAFQTKRINKINRRKEFFKVDLLDIENKAKEITNDECEFKITAVAEDYYESLKLMQNAD
jgi:hypothetical protein